MYRISSIYNTIASLNTTSFEESSSNEEKGNIQSNAGSHNSQFIYFTNEKQTFIYK